MAERRLWLVHAGKSLARPQNQASIICYACELLGFGEHGDGSHSRYVIAICRSLVAMHTHGCQRMFKEFLPRIEESKRQAFLARGKKLEDAWYLGILATDPDHEGHGM